MNITAIIINGIAVAALILAFIKDKDNAVQKQKKSRSLLSLSCLRML